MKIPEILDSVAEQATFLSDLRKLINRYSLESCSDSPDWLLAEYLYGCLEVFNRATRLRDAAK